MDQTDEFQKEHQTSSGMESEKLEVSWGGLSSSLSWAQATLELEPKSFLLWASVSQSMKWWALDLFTQ